MKLILFIIQRFRFQFYLFTASLITVLLSQISYGQQSPIRDALNDQNTPILQSVAQCLPIEKTDIGQIPAVSWYSLIDSVELSTPLKNGAVRFHYINVYVAYEEKSDTTAPDLSEIYPWPTLVKVKSDGSCQNLMPSITNVTRSLTQFMPLDAATQLVVSRYRLSLQTPAKVADFLRYIQNRPGPFSSPGAEMDAVPPRDQMDAPLVCQLNPEEAAAVTQLGYTHKCKIRSIQ